MANPENLKKGKATQFRSGEEAAINGRKGGKASGESRRKKADFREDLNAALTGIYTIKDDAGTREMTGTQMAVMALLKIATDPENKNAAVQAFNTMAKMLGQDVPDQSSTDDDKVLEFLKALKDG